MLKSDYTKLLSLTIDKERKLEKNYCDFIHTFDIQWKKANDNFRNRLMNKKKEETAYKLLDNQIEKLETEIEVIRSSLLNCELQAAERKIKLSHVENEIVVKSNQQEKLEEQCEILEVKKNKLKKIFKILKEAESLYDKYLACNLLDEGFNSYLLSFIYGGQAIGAIRFEFNECKNHFIVLDFKPKNIVSDNLIQQFNETQDTQWLLCYFRQLLKN